MCTDSLKCRIRILDSRIGTNFFFPEYLSNGLSGFFLRACIKEKIYIFSEQTILISTGILVNLFDKNVDILIKPLHKIKETYKIVIGNPFSIKNFFYNNELKISIWNCSKKIFCIHPGDQIAQLIILTNKKIKFLYI
ncbi:Deoxyuridine 5'-triphosphate nucleotidohydrolase [Buchnera aphidicola (Cinara piceae)]|uniref:Deoxyuridine 5'-triphosphate nucleotidohydrolase, partial n=1 Tax=Buchnera aphidicola (Cinara piceae) TaxID=1660043 RepID=A0A803FUG7_9GAMM|nr:dUTP diphosphatase [Buchnera aphidicola]VFP88786.1 Deoxyuridine 5'-triphosphate nucleotidohydrolase [Buchnera aphidicola (Cinara piceae)]